MKRIIPLMVYFILFIIKLGAYFYSGLFVIFAEAMHSLIDAILIAILFFSSRLSLKPADSTHPYGHERMENIASMMVSTAFITVVSFELFKGSLKKIFSQELHVYYTGPIVYLILVISLLAVIGMSVYSRKRMGIFHRTVFVETFNDTLSTIAAIIGIFLVSSGYPVFDGISGLIVAILIAINAFLLLRSNASFLLGKSPPEEFYDKIMDVVSSVKEVRGVHDMMAEYIGENSIHVDLHITLPPEMSIEEADKITERISTLLKENDERIKVALIHVCPHHGGKRKFRVK